MTSSSVASSLFYDAVVAFLPVQQVQVMAQVDGQRFIGASGNVLRFWPGVRVFPLEREMFSVGLGAQLWFEDLADDWSLRRAGALPTSAGPSSEASGFPDPNGIDPGKMFHLSGKESNRSGNKKEVPGDTTSPSGKRSRPPRFPGGARLFPG